LPRWRWTIALQRGRSSGLGRGQNHPGAVYTPSSDVTTGSRFFVWTAGRAAPVRARDSGATLELAANEAS
jgi:hypothetical protein